MRCPRCFRLFTQPIAMLGSTATQVWRCGDCRMEWLVRVAHASPADAVTPELHDAL